MPSIRELTFDEITKVSGGEGHGSEWARDKRDAAMNASLNGAGAGYGAVPNIDVDGMNAAGRAIWANRQCIGSMAIGIFNGVTAARSGSFLGYASTVATALSDVNSTCGKSSGVPFR
ncbi:TPA: hypothetical protein ACHBXQ_005439 [Klebsiella variicola subsp. variicola]